MHTRGHDIAGTAEKVLNPLGLEGWEAYAVLDNWVYLKRPILVE